MLGFKLFGSGVAYFINYAVISYGQAGNFFKYLLAKGFPTAITIMQIGVVLVIVIALYQKII